MFSNIHFGLTVPHKATYHLKLTNKEVNKQIYLDGQTDHGQTDHGQTDHGQTDYGQTDHRQTDRQTDTDRQPGRLTNERQFLRPYFRLKGATSQPVHIEKISLNFPSSSFPIRVNLLHPYPSSYPLGLLVLLWCFSILPN